MNHYRLTDAMYRTCQIFMQDDDEQLTVANRTKYRIRITTALRVSQRAGWISAREHHTLANLDHITISNTGSGYAPEVANFYNPRPDGDGYDGFSLVIHSQRSNQTIGDITG